VLAERRAAALFAAIALTASATAGCGLFGKDPQPDPAARAFLDAWADGDVAGAANATDDATSAQAALQATKEALAPTKADLVAGAPTVNGNQATVPFQASWSLRGVGDQWRYDGRLSLVKQDKAWKVHWEPADLHPQLAAGQKLAVQRALPERAPLLASTGAPLFALTDVVTIGVEPRRVTNLPSLAATLASVLGVRAADVVADVGKAKPDQFVTVITLRKPDYLKIKPRVYDLAGTVFRSERRLLGPSTRFAQPLLGTVGDATKEVLDEAGPGYLSGDQLGRSGLQRALNASLAGVAGAKVVATDEQGKTVTVLGEIAARPGKAVRTTLDPTVQNAADAAVAAVTTPAAIVAIQPSTGNLLAVSNNTAAPGDIALTGRYPAGSTFKAITATALLQAGVVKPTSVLPCPATTVVYGKQFQNEDKFDLGSVPLRTAFAKSCNTTFTSLSQQLPRRALADAAAKYGIAAKYRLPVPSFDGSVPTPKDDTEKAADAIGQGRVEVSPLAMALVAAGVQHGEAVAPALVTGIPAAPGGRQPDGPPPAVLPALRDMMRAVVTSGTATELADIPGAPISGKTGTAEYGTAVPPRAHAWFIGYRGDFAFAVFVYDGESSHTAAVPMAHTFLTALGR
jgi:cell division protein FtsI/penicillin-binding protein 2